MDDNPLDMVERMALESEWSIERSPDEITILVQGVWDVYRVSFTWIPTLSVLHLACAFGFKVQEPRLDEARRLISLINEHLWVGHFDLWSEEELVMWRHALLLDEHVQATTRQCNTMLRCGVEACEQFYQAFQYVVWGGRPAKESLDMALFETKGEA